MAAIDMSTFFVVIVFALAGCSHGLSADCTPKDQVAVMAKLATCVTSKHPEYFLTLLTKIPHPASMESPDFMCSNQDMMSGMVDCLLQYVEGCLPPSVASQVATVMPSHHTVTLAVRFLCAHKDDFKNKCVTSQVPKLLQCFSTKMQAFSHLPYGHSTDMKSTVCSALQVEEECLATSLADCPATVTSNIMSGLLAFFPTENCHIVQPGSNKVLLFQPERQH